jgi:hypothetical protein
MRDIADLGSAIVVKVQDTQNYKLPSFTILGKFYVEICRKYLKLTQVAKNHLSFATAFFSYF